MDGDEDEEEDVSILKNRILELETSRMDLYDKIE